MHVGFVYMGIFFEHKLMCFACFIFRKDIFTRKKTEQEKQKDQKRGKNAKLKQPEKDKISFLYK